MPHSLADLVPSLQALGVWTYWILAAAAFLEAVILAGVVVPGALAVIAGGMLVRLGTIGFLDLAWFVGLATVAGSEVSFRLGHLAETRLHRVAASPSARRATALVDRWGGAALVVARFLGPLSAFVPFAAGVARMSNRRFLAWNVASSVAYALVLPALGYFFGAALATAGPAVPRVLGFAAGAVAVLAIVWLVASRLVRAWPHVRDAAAHLFAHMPRLARRLDPARASGLTATVLVLLFVWLLALYLDSTFDFLGDPPVVAADTRLANLLFAFRDDRLVRFFAHVTLLGSWRVTVPLLLGTTVALALLRRRDLMAGLWVAALGNQITVFFLKALFARERSDLGVFLETSGSFPSGHAAASVAVWGMLWFVAWRAGAIPALGAALGGVTVAFVIGLSRIYLIEHYLSDVLNGALVGALWLVIGIGVAAWARTLRPWHGAARPRTAAGVTLATVAAAALLVATLSSTERPRRAATAAVAVADVPAEVTRTGVATLDILGHPRGRIDLVATPQSEAALTGALEAAGWTSVGQASLPALARAVWADWTGGVFAGPLVRPRFWNGHPNDLAFERAVPGAAPNERAHLRLWATGWTTGARVPVWVGAATVEDVLDPDDLTRDNTATVEALSMLPGTPIRRLNAP